MPTGGRSAGPASRGLRSAAVFRQALRLAGKPSVGRADTRKTPFGGGNPSVGCADSSPFRGAKTGGSKVSWEILLPPGLFHLVFTCHPEEPQATKDLQKNPESGSSMERTGFSLFFFAADSSLALRMTDIFAFQQNGRPQGSPLRSPAALPPAISRKRRGDPVGAAISRPPMKASSLLRRGDPCGRPPPSRPQSRGNAAVIP